MTNNNIDWEDVENKISIICRKFDNLDSFKEDLAQELRIHAYYKSDDYWDLWRRAIDFWRMVKAKHTPEIPYLDLDILGRSYKDESKLEFDEFVAMIRKELEAAKTNKWEEKRIQLSEELLDIILTDIDERVPRKRGDNNPPQYIKGRLNLSWVAERNNLPYKRLVISMKLLEEKCKDVMKKLSE